jgi:dihydrolipoamide dehydrogenase
MAMHTQLAVLGGGPGGYAAAFFAADKGMDVTLVEQEERLGGTCLLRGCVPSKALLHLTRVIGEVDALRTDWGVSFGGPEIDLVRIRARKEEVITTLSSGLAQLAKRRQVGHVRARGVLQDSSTLSLDGDDPSIPDDRQLSFEHLILATGSSVVLPALMDIESERVIDSSGALALAEIPGSMLVIGGGYIGLEMGTVYAGLGTRVSVVELTDGLLPGVDRNLVKPLQRRFEALLDGRIYLDTKVRSLGVRDGNVEVAFEGPGKFGTEHYDQVLVSVGRQPNSQNIGLERTNVQFDQHGFVQCDSQQRTDDPRVFAIGDVAGQPMLAHKATHQGKVAVQAILGEPAQFDSTAIPAVIFTDPEIAWVGLTEERARKEGRRVKVAFYPWAASGRAHAMGRTEGLTKWLFDPETDRALGCGIVGVGAGEMIAEAVLAIEMRCEARDVVESIHPHPTMSETLMNAAEVYLGTATEIYKPR